MKQISFRSVIFLLRLISYLPFPILYFLSDIIYFLLYYVFRYRRIVVATNLKNAFPERSDQELRSIEKRFYAFLGDMMVESVKSITITEDELRKRFIIKNKENLTRILNENKSLIAVSGHYGNWEWGPLRIGLELKQKVMVVYKPLSDKNFESFINTIRSRFGTLMVPMKNTLRKLSEYKSEPHILVLVGDQTPPKEESQYFIPFLNQPTAVFLGVEKIANRMDYPVVYFSINRLKRGYYECKVNPLIKDSSFPTSHEITYAHTRMLEKDIQKEPEFWLWSHKRWKFKPEDIK